MSQFHWASKKKKLWRLLKVEGSIFNYRVPPFWRTYVGERRTTFAKSYGIKVRCYGEHVGEHIGNLMGTHWVLIGNVVGTHWEPEKNEKKNPSPPPHPNIEGKKKQGNLSAYLDWVHEISLTKRVCHHFWPELLPLAKNTLLIMESTPKLCGLTIMWSFVLAF
jgi:hypothetical protein